MCLFTCLLKELGSVHAKSYGLHMFDFSPLCVFKCVLNGLPDWMHNHIGCICLTFLRCEFSNVFSTWGISPTNFISFPHNFASFPHNFASFPQQFASYPQQIASFPQTNSHFPITILLHFAKSKIIHVLTFFLLERVEGILHQGPPLLIVCQYLPKLLSPTGPAASSRISPLPVLSTFHTHIVCNLHPRHILLQEVTLLDCLHFHFLQCSQLSALISKNILILVYRAGCTRSAVELEVDMVAEMEMAEF